jgi:hypothetical protein
VEVLQLAARFTKNPRASDISADERDAFKNEKKVGFWSQSKSLKCAVILTGTLAGMCQGWSQSVLNGSAPYLADYLGLHVRTQDPRRNDQDLWTFGILQATVPVAAGILLVPTVTMSSDVSNDKQEPSHSRSIAISPSGSARCHRGIFCCHGCSCNWRCSISHYRAADRC